jgi:hypothetical protein
MSSHYEATIRKPLVIGDKSYHDVTVDVAAPVEGSKQTLVDCIFNRINSFPLGYSLYNLHRINRNRNMGIK